MRSKTTGLTARQEEVLKLTIQGYTPYGIAGILFITESCAKLHMQNIYRKLGVNHEKGKDLRIMAIMKYLELKGVQIEL